MKTSIRLLFVLIHNQDKGRYEKIRPNLDLLKENLAPKFIVEIIEIVKQPQAIPHPLILTLLRKSIYWKLNREWEKYKGFNTRNIFFDFGILLARLMAVLKNRKRENQRGVIETFLVDKHIKAWNYFLENNHDFLVVFEDDVIFKKDSIHKFRKTLNKLIKNINKLIYVDLAGGNGPEINRVDKLQIKADTLGKYYKKPVTNTACCYLINQSTVEIFSMYLLKNPWLRFVGGDWLMNKIFIMTESRYKYFCLHTDPAIFNHGSVNGVFESSI